MATVHFDVHGLLSSHAVKWTLRLIEREPLAILSKASLIIDGA